MAESGQQPTVDATLVNDIFEMLMEMDIRKMIRKSTSASRDSILTDYYMTCATYNHRKSVSQCGAPAQIYVAAAEDSAKSQ